MRSLYTPFIRSKKFDAASGPYAAAAFEKVPWRNSSARSEDDGLPDVRTPVASVSAVTLTHPSFRPRLLHVFFSKAATSFGSNRLTALSAPPFPTLIIITLIASATTPRRPVATSVERTVTTKRSWFGWRAPRLVDSTGKWKVSAPDGWRIDAIAVSPGARS